MVPKSNNSFYVPIDRRDKSSSSFAIIYQKSFITRIRYKSPKNCLNKKKKQQIIGKQSKMYNRLFSRCLRINKNK